MNNFNTKLCDERHEVIDREFKKVWTRVGNMDARIWGVMILLLMNLGGIIAIITKLP